MINVIYTIERYLFFVKSAWYCRSGLMGRSLAHNPKVQVRFPPPPWDPTLVLVLQRTLRGLFLAHNVVPKMENYVLFLIKLLFVNKYIGFAPLCGIQPWC